ncbi:MAG: tetratricopeptide repeat protein, partial [candidate division Zixibacteria bacterium]|nr:tetratricopeptide repeat protein [candidate division Zixibacteria bacterium]
MKFRIINTILFIIISLFSSFDVSYGATAIHSLRLTGYPDIDFEPTVSPNDEWIAFTSYRDGDFNIYLKSTSRGIPRRLTNHTSADFNPCFDNNSENVYFVSRRDDALGDIYKINIETGFIKRITDNKGYDSEPAISPDGKRLAFCSDRQSGYMDIFIAKKNGDIINRIPTSRGGINPSWSPDSKKLTFIALDTTGFGGANHLSISDLEGNIEYISTGTGPVMHPRFSHDGSMILMTQYSVDTNKDGTLTIDDIPCISAYIIEKQIIVKLIFADDAVFSATPSLNSKWLYYAVGKEKDIDIARIDFSRLWAIYSLPDSLYDYSQNFSTSTDSTELLTAIKYLESFSAIYKDNPDTPGAIIKCGDLYQKLGFYREAIAVWGKVDSEFDNTAYNIALLRIAGLQADRSWHLDRRSTLRRVLSRIKKIREQNKNDTSVTSEALYLKGNLLFRYGDFNQAVASFQAVVDSFSQNAEVSCRSLLRIADIYKTLDPRAKLANAENYLEVINQHPEQKAFADSAVVYALRQYEDQPVQERINGIRILLDNLKEKRLLQAAGEFEIARIHEGNGNYSGALDQYNSAAISYPEQISFSVNARLKSAELKLYSSEPEEGVSELESILNLGEADNDLKDKVKDIIYFYKLEQGRKSLQNINYPKARSVFEELIIKFPDRGGCHWGFMKCCAKLKDIDHADKFYGKLKKDGLISRGTSYGNALLSLEKYKQQDNKGELRRARELLEELNELFFDWIFPYVTLGDVYLRTEAAGIDKEIGGFSEKAIDMSLRGLISLGDDASEELKKNLTLNLATGYYYIGQYQQSFASYKSSGDFVKSLNDGVVLNDYLWNLGDAALQIDSLRRASSCFETLFKSAEERSDTYFKLRLLTKLGYVYLLQEEFDKAQRYFNRALDIYTSLNDDQGKAEVLKALSATSFMDQEYGTCIKYVEISDSLYSILKPSDDIKTSNLLLGRLPLLPVDFQLAEIEEIKIGGSFFQKGFPFDVNRRLLNEFKAESYANLGEIHSAASCYKVKIHLEDKAGDSRSAGATANKLANMYQNAGMPDSSVVYYRQAIDYSKDASFYTGVAVNAVNLSNLLFSFPELRIKYSKESKEDIMSDLQVSIRNIAGEISAFKIYAYCALANWYYLDYTESIISKIGEHENSIVAADDWISSLKNDKFSSISENLLTAAKYYRNAREIALRLKDKHILAIVNRNLSIISANLGKINDYEDFLSKAETTSTENGFGDLLWRILIDREIISRSEVPDDENWNKAFEVLKTLRGYKNPFAFPQDKQLLEITFNRYLDYLIQNGQTTNALWALELFRSMKLAGEFARYPTRSFRSELHKVYWQNIHYLDSMTDSLSSMIWSLEAQGDLTSLNKIDSLNVELSSINDELSQTLEKIIAEYPGLSPLVYPTLPDSNDIRQFLGDEKIIFNFYVFENGIGTWLIDHDSTQFSFKPIENEILKKKVRTTVDSIGTPSADKYSEELFELLFGDHVESIENSGNIIIIPNDILYRLPFSLLNDGNLFLTDITDYSISSSFSMAVNGYLNRHIPSAGTIIIKDINDSISRRRKKKKYAIASSDSIPKAISDYGVLIFKDGINIEPGYPLGSTLNFPGKKKPQLSELLTYKLKSKAIILHDIDIGNLNVYSPLLQASFNYAGAPSLIINRWQIPDEVYNEFHSNFIPLLDSLDVVSSLGIAKSRLKNKYPDKMYWAGFELFGYDGMNKAEEFVFAEEKFGILMRKGNIAAGENHWDDALEYFKEANHLSSKLNFDDSQKLMILQRIVLSAFRGEQFLTAEEYQKEILQVWQSVEDTKEIQKAILNLRDIAVRGKNFAKAAGYQKQYVLLTRKISKSGDFAAGLGDVASLYDLAKDYKKAIAVTDSALLLASDDEKESVSARISFTKG